MVFDDLKYIRKKYGENMSHLCRELFPTILEKPGLLYNLLTSSFCESKELYYDIVNEHKEIAFKNYILSFYESKKEDKKTEKGVRELLDEAGYTLYECKTNADVKKFKKYYAKGEEICTFKDSHRIDDYHIFFIVKKNVNNIKRENFPNPRREDEYSTSILCIQFDRGTRQSVTIISRYNHTVSNPNAVYSNNLDAIVENLTDAFENEYGFNIGGTYKTNFALNRYFEAKDGKFYKYNYEMYQDYWCHNNILIENRRKIIYDYTDKSRYLFMDYFVLDLKEKKLLSPMYKAYDDFKSRLSHIKSIKVTNKEDFKEIEITLEEEEKVTIKLDQEGRIIGYIDENLTKIYSRFLEHNTVLREISLPNLEYCDDFLSRNLELKSIDLPKLKHAGFYFLRNNQKLSKLNLPLLEDCYFGFLKYNQELREISLPNLERCDEPLLRYNTKVRYIYLPKYCGCFNDFEQSAFSEEEISNYFEQNRLRRDQEVTEPLKVKAKKRTLVLKK